MIVVLFLLEMRVVFSNFSDVRNKHVKGDSQIIFPVLNVNLTFGREGATGLSFRITINFHRSYKSAFILLGGDN